MIDLSWIIGAVIAILIAIALYKVWPAIKAFIPAGALWFINWFAEIVVKAVETEHESGEGQKKKEEAFERINTALAPLIAFMEKFGYTISAERIYEAIQAAWIKLDLEEFKAGIKYFEYDEEEFHPPEEKSDAIE